MRSLVIFFFVLGTITGANARQRTVKDVEVKVDTLSIVSSYLQKLQKLVEQRDSMSIVPFYPAPNAYYYQILSAPTLYSSPLHQMMNNTDSTYADKQLQTLYYINNMLAKLYARHPELVQQTEESIKDKGKFRDDMRRFLRGDDHLSTAAATRISGSSDCYNHSGRSPLSSINFITAHDGFTLNDLVSYNYKHNEENGEGNRDGSDDNLSYNNGFEGECTNPKIEMARLRTIKNFLVYLFVSQGVPMMLGGDEMRRTQLGNNNAYCQDNSLSWFNWKLAERNKGLVRFTSRLIEMRRTHNIFSRIKFFRDTYETSAIPEISWYDMTAKVPDWAKMNHFLAFKLDGLEVDNDFYVATNLDQYDLTITLPTLPGNKKWYRVADTSFESPDDILDKGNEELLTEQRRYVLISGATIILMSK